MRKYLLALLLASSSAASADDLGILEIYEQFTLVSAAAGKCLEPDEEELTSFLANYQMVSVFADRELKKRKRDLTDEEARRILEAGGLKLTEMVYDEIEEEGCESPKIQDLLERFHMQAEWQP